MSAGPASDMGCYVNFASLLQLLQSPGSIIKGILYPNDVAG